MNNNIHEYLLENLFDGVYYVDKNRVITYWNRSAERITGYKREEVITKRCADNILRHIDLDGNELCTSTCPLFKTINDGKIRDVDVFLHHKQGHRVPVSVRISPLKDDNGTIIGAVEIFTDKSDRTDMIRHMERIQKETFIDPVTKVGNKKYAMAILNNRFTELKTFKVLFGILFVKVTNISMIRQSYGNFVGNSALEMTARTIKSCLKSVDIVGRWEDDTFIVIVPNIPDEQALKILRNRIIRFVDTSWLHVEKQIVHVSVVVSYTMSKFDETVFDLIQRAENQLANEILSQSVT